MDLLPCRRQNVIRAARSLTVHRRGRGRPTQQWRQLRSLPFVPTPRTSSPFLLTKKRQTMRRWDHRSRNPGAILMTRSPLNRCRMAVYHTIWTNRWRMVEHGRRRVVRSRAGVRRGVYYGRWLFSWLMGTPSDI